MLEDGLPLICGGCEQPIENELCDLGWLPCLNHNGINAKSWLPLKLLICDHCYLVQLKHLQEEHINPMQLLKTDNIGLTLQQIEEMCQQEGSYTLELPYLHSILMREQFERINLSCVYYFTVSSLERCLAYSNLSLFDVDISKKRGGIIKVTLKNTLYSDTPHQKKIDLIKARESKAGLNDLNAYRFVNESFERYQNSLFNFLVELKLKAEKIALFGPLEQMMTFCYYSGLTHRIIDVAIDPQNHYRGKLPQIGIPIKSVEHLLKNPTDHLIVLNSKLPASYYPMVQKKGMKIISTNSKYNLKQLIDNFV